MFWICLILTKSPIWLIFCLILTGIYFLKTIVTFILKHIVKFIIAIVLICVLTFIFFTQLNLSETYLNRIYLTIKVLGNWELFVIIEPSLATRILSYFYTFKVFLSNFILGVGLGNTKYYTINQIFNTPIPITLELQKHITNTIFSGSNRLGLNGAFFFDVLADSGIIGCIVFYYFLFKSYIWNNKIKMKYTGINYLLLDGLSKSVLAFILISFYDVNYMTLFVWFLLGLGLIFYPICKR